MNRTPDEIKKGLEDYFENRHQPTYDQWHDGVYSIPDALALIQQLEAQAPKWISVEERLPEAHMFVIVYVTNPAEWWDIELDCVDEHGNWTINADSEWHTVTHWMSLPEPPKEHDNAKSS